MLIMATGGSICLSDQERSSEELSPGLDFRHFEKILKNHVDNNGMVNYKALKAKPDNLDSFINIIANLNPDEYETWDHNAKVAFWINCYNALTLKVIIYNYPIKSSFFRSQRYPSNSIRQIPGVWKKITFTVMGKKLTLDEIEHRILRKRFDEPRIHMALVCAAKGCPPLLNEPYRPKELDRQLAQQSRKFLSDPLKFRMDNNTVYLSPIFKWFADDFVSKYGSNKDFAQYKEPAASVLSFISGYLEGAVQQLLKSSEPLKIKYLQYNWTLNEQKK